MFAKSHEQANKCTVLMACWTSVLELIKWHKLEKLGRKNGGRGGGGGRDELGRCELHRERNLHDICQSLIALKKILSALKTP